MKLSSGYFSFQGYILAVVVAAIIPLATFVIFQSIETIERSSQVNASDMVLSGLGVFALGLLFGLPICLLFSFFPFLLFMRLFGASIHRSLFWALFLGTALGILVGLLMGLVPFLSGGSRIEAAILLLVFGGISGLCAGATYRYFSIRDANWKKSGF